MKTLPQERFVLLLALGAVLGAAGVRAEAQESAPNSALPTAPSSAIGSGGTIRGTVKAGAAPLPGVNVVATNTLTGKKYSCATGIDGAFSMSIPQNGRYVLRTDFAGFAAETKEALLNAASHEQTVSFELTLASRAQTGEAAGQTASTQGTRQYSGEGAQNLNLLGAMAGALAAGSGSGASGADLPAIAGNSSFSSDSVAISGQAGTTDPLAGINTDQLRENFENQRQLDSLSQSPGSSRGDRGFGGPGGGGPPGGGFVIGRGAFRKFRPDQPHGAIFWNGGNSAWNAKPFALRGQQSHEPGYGSNRFGLVFIGEPYIPKLTKPSTKDTLFLMFNGQRTSSPFDQYASVPTAAERAGDFSGMVDSQGRTIPVYDPRTGKPFPGNQIPADRLTAQARALINFIPAPNLPGALQNYHLGTTQQTNTTMLGARYIRNVGAAGNSRVPAFLAQFSNAKGLRQNLNFNFNYMHSASDRINIFPQLGGKLGNTNYAFNAGYSIGRGNLTNNFSVGWNRSRSQTTNFFTGVQDVATEAGILGPGGNPLNLSPLNYGLPSVVLSQFSGLNQLQPSFRLTQTISFSESSSWLHKKHNVRWGGDYRRVHLDVLGGNNATGTFYFTGYATAAPGTQANASGLNATGSPIADLLLGLPQETTIQSPGKKAYLRSNVWDLFVQDDFRVLPNLTLLAGLRYESFSPYVEKFNELATLDANADFTQVAPVFPGGNGPFTGSYPRSLIEGFHGALAPRVGFALRPMRDTVLRGGYGINFTNSEYAGFALNLAHQPPFANVQTNQVTQGAVLSLANGFPAPQATGNFSVNKHYHLPYVQVWNLDLQRTLPMGIVLNVGYNGSKGTHLDITTAPGRSGLTSASGVYFNYEDSLAFSNFNALTVRARKRLRNGVSMGVTYAYSHSIDNAGSVGGTSTIVAQNWQNLLAEEGNSSFDIRHKATGDYLFELPFGPDKAFLNGGGWASHVFSNLSISGNFTFATGAPLTPRYAAAFGDVARGTAGTLRADRVPGASVTAGGGSLNRWFNTAAFAFPAGSFGNASRNSIPGPGTVSNDMSLAKTVHLGDTRSFEFRATANNVFNTVQYASVDSTIDSRTAGLVTSAQNMRQISLMGRFRF